MAAWRYKISLRVLKKYFTRSRKNIFQHSKRNFVSPRGHVISSIYPKFDEEQTLDYRNLTENDVSMF